MALLTQLYRLNLRKSTKEKLIITNIVCLYLNTHYNKDLHTDARTLKIANKSSMLAVFFVFLFKVTCSFGFVFKYNSHFKCIILMEVTNLYTSVLNSTILHIYVIKTFEFVRLCCVLVSKNHIDV